MEDKIPLSVAQIGDAECNAARDVILSGWMTHGPKNEELEERFKSYLGVAGALCVNSGFSALYLALKASGVRGEVILPSFTHVASANAVVAAGATPVFADIDAASCNVCPRSIQRCLSAATQAVMAVHYAGQPCDMDPILQIVEERKLALIEDSAETLGGTCQGRQAGSFGIGCFSFFPTKNMTTGEGGLLCSNDLELMEHARSLAGHGIRSTTWLRSHGQTERAPWHREASEFGFNFRMSNILAAIGVVQMDKLEQMNQSRRHSARYLIEGLRDEERIVLPIELPGRRHVYQMFTIQVKGLDRESRDAFVWKLRSQNIEASVHFDPPLHQQAIYRHMAKDRMEATDRISASIVTLPLFPGMTAAMLDKIIDAVRNTLPSSPSAMRVATGAAFKTSREEI